MPIHNEDIARAFDEIADLLEIDEANPFRVRAYRNAARSVRELGRELADMVAAGEDLTELPAIGDDLAAKIEQMVKTGHMQALDKLHRRLPAGLEPLMQLPGLGAKRVAALYRKLGIDGLAALRRAADAGKIRLLAGFGEKTEARILEALAAHRESEHRILRRTATAYAEPLVAWLRRADGVREVVVAGSYRRGRETVGDLDILVAAADGERVMQHLLAYDEIGEVLSHGHTRTTVLLRSGLQVDVRVVPRKSFGAALHYFTGSKGHNIAIRRLGQQRGLKINEYGIFKSDRRLDGNDETDVFKAVGLPFIEPELREASGEIEAARRHRLPHLIEADDLRGDLHMHTTATDGHADLRRMVLAARDYGLEYVAVTEHSQHLHMVHGLDAKRLLAQIDEIEELGEEIDGITILKGIEVDILENGDLDLPREVLSHLDLVIGAVHSHFDLPQKHQTARILRAMDAPCFSILAHPTGRLLGEREAYAVDMERIVEHARDRECFLELDAQPQRLDLDDRHCRLAREYGVLVAIDSDAHRPEDFANLADGVIQARRGWLQAEDVLNTRRLSELRRLLRRTMA
jgi:DNA polymerase (family X)